MFEFAGVTSGDSVTANDVGVTVKLYGQSNAYLFDREFYDEFVNYLSDRIDAIEFDPREDFETPHEHLERINIDIETVDFHADGVWVF
jgi:hypothetical protein